MLFLIHCLSFLISLRFRDDKEIKKNIKNLEILENDNKQKDGNKIYLYFTMGKMFEKINKYDKAIHYYNLGNNLKRKYIDYSIDYDEKRFNQGEPNVPSSHSY